MNTSFNLFFKQVTIRQAILVDNLKTFLVVTKHQYSADKTSDMKLFNAEFINFLLNRPTDGKFKYIETVLDTLKNMGILKSTDWSDLFKEIKDRADKSYQLSKIKFKKEKKVKMQFHSHNTADGLDLQRTIAIRSKYGDTPVKFYELRGSMNSKSNQEVNNLKLEYHYETGCKYYETRPILYSTWITLPPAYQQATCICDKQD